MSVGVYVVYNPSGQAVMEAPECCRYPRRIELGMLEAGYTIKLNGKRITKAELRKEKAGNDRIPRMEKESGKWRMKSG